MSATLNLFVNTDVQIWLEVTSAPVQVAIGFPATTEHAKISMNVKKIIYNAAIDACALIGLETIPVLIRHVQYLTKQERSKIKKRNISHRI